MTAATQYWRLPGRSGLLIRNSLWMGPDHLLRVRRNPFSESYRRYYFADIQAIVLTELPGTAATYGYGAAALLIVAATLLVYARHPVGGGVCAFFAVAAILLSWQIAKCACYIETSISSDRLPSLARRGNAAKALAILKAEIERTQGSVTHEVLETHPPDARTGRTAPPRQALRHCGGQAHWILFALMLLRGAMASFTWLAGVTSVPWSIASSVLGSAILLLLILAAILQHRSDLAVGTRRLVYVALAWYVLSGLSSFAVSMYIVVQLGPRANPALIMAHPVLKAYELVDLMGFLVLGCLGLILLWRHQRAAGTPPPLVSGNQG